MPLSWNEIRVRATAFSKDWKDAHYEKGETQSFYNDFFNVFGQKRRSVAVYEEKVKKLNDNNGFIDLFWPGTLLVEQKSAGRNLSNAREQATDYFLSIKEREKPRYILLSDFQTFELLDLEEQKEHHFTLAELPEKIRLFDFVAGYQRQKYEEQHPVNIKASELMSNLHKQLEESGYVGNDLERLLVRTMFALFADDTGIFEPDIFLSYIENHTKEDGTDLGSHLVHLFQVLDTPSSKRQKTLNEDLAAFPYVNGELFNASIRTPSFDSSMRNALLECCYFNWSKVSPALFGSLFQTVMLPEEQRQGGAHYTSEKNILKTIRPLFMDGLRDEFERLKENRSTQKKSKLEKFHDKLSGLTFFDPACGCGNFLILAYRELRQLEIEILEEVFPAKERQKVLDVEALSKIDVDQFYGIEIEEFPARIAEAAMWLVDHQMNMKLSEAFGQAFVRLPLKKSAHILHGNALTTDWENVLSSKNCNYILGNPPFIGKKEQTKEQKNDLDRVFHGVKGRKILDYVTCWYLKAVKYIQDTKIRVAFVSTKSIVQGEQVGVLWKELYKFGGNIFFAHQVFKWTIDEKKARGMKIASVHVVIIGFAAEDIQSKFLFEYDTVLSDPHAIKASIINPYLVEGPSTVILRRDKPICNVPEISKGSEATDFGYLILKKEEKEELVNKEPLSEKWIRRFVGGEELINNIERYCLWLVEATPAELRAMPLVMKRIEEVKKERLKSSKKRTVDWAKRPALFSENRQPDADYLAIPKVSSERRDFIPIGFVDQNWIASGSVQTLADATLFEFGILSSTMHMAWMRYVAGRTKSDYQYSNTIVYNNFSWPSPNEKQRQEIEKKAEAVINTRDIPDSSLADLYDPNTMPSALLKAHQELDKAVDKAYRKAVFKDEKERIAFLFDLYQQITEPLIPKEKKKRKRT